MLTWRSRSSPEFLKPWGVFCGTTTISPRGRLDLLAADSEGADALEHDERLLVGVDMEPGPLARRVPADEGRDGGAVVAALEAAGALAAREVC